MHEINPGNAEVDTLPGGGEVMGENRAEPGGQKGSALRVAPMKSFLTRIETDTESSRETSVRELQEQVAALQSQLTDIRRECQELRRDSSAHARSLKKLSADLEAERKDRLCGEEAMRQDFYEHQSWREISTLSGSESSNQIAYRHLIQRIRDVVRRTVPRDSTVVVVSKGDDELLRFYGQRAWHFPQNKEGVYAGYYPRTSAAAIAHLEALRARGATHLLFPATALWWLNDGKYAEFKGYLERRFRLAVSNEDTCVIFSLNEPAPWAEFGAAVAECQDRLERELTILDWDTEQNLAGLFPHCTVFSAPAADGSLPYLDRSVDVVATADHTRLDEARRVARELVVHVKDGGAEVVVEWVAGSAEAELPTVSIIIPVYNQSEYTEACLTSLRETLPRGFRGEIVLVDDASSDNTPALLKRWAKLDGRIKVVRNKKNVGFLASSTRGVRESSGEVILFLNNDTVLLPGWLPPLLRVFRDYKDAGAVGGKLLFHDGTLQEAGGIIFRDGSAANFGRGEQDADALLYNYIREVDYCSGALLATRRTLFMEIGGFDTRYSPAYCEDSDYCFAVRKAGYRVYYQPASAIIHVEGGTSGTDLSTGVKRYQVINNAKFTEKWKEALKQQPARPDYSDHEAWKLLAVRNRGEGGDTR